MTVGSTVVKPGGSTSLTFPYRMGPGMSGPHHFVVSVTTNDPGQPKLTFTVLANSVE